MSVSPTSKTLNIGETVQLTGTKNPTSASEGTQWTSSNTGVATVSGSGLVTAKAAGTATITFKNSSSTKSATCKIVVNDPTISIVESYVSYYADINDDGIVDGIIYADLLHGHSGTFGSNSSGNYTIPTISNPKQYYISQKGYSGDFGTKDVIAPLKQSVGNDRFYILSLNDFDSQLYKFGYANGGTSSAFGKCKENSKLICSKYNYDMWKVIKDQVNQGWFVPSKEEWAAVGNELNITTGNNYSQSKENSYTNRNLLSKYWSSTEAGVYSDEDYNAWIIYFNNGGLSSNGYGHNQKSYVRLSITF